MILLTLYLIKGAVVVLFLKTDLGFVSFFKVTDITDDCDCVDRVGECGNDGVVDGKLSEKRWSKLYFSRNV